MSDLGFKPIHKFFRLINSSVKYAKDTNSDVIFLHVYNNSLFKLTLLLGFLGYYAENASCHKKHVE